MPKDYSNSSSLRICLNIPIFCVSALQNTLITAILHVLIKVKINRNMGYYFSEMSHSPGLPLLRRHYRQYG